MRTKSMRRPVIRALPLVGIVEELPHRQRRGGLLTDGCEPADVLRGQRILEEEQPVRLDVLGELQRRRSDGGARARRGAARCRHPAGCERSRSSRAWLGRRRGGRSSCPPGRPSVCGTPRVGPTVATHLDPHVAIALLDEPPCVRPPPPSDLTVGVNVDGGRFSALAAQELIDGHARPLAFDVPQRLIDTGDGVVEHRDRCASTR